MIDITTLVNMTTKEWHRVTFRADLSKFSFYQLSKFEPDCIEVNLGLVGENTLRFIGYERFQLENVGGVQKPELGKTLVSCMNNMIIINSVDGDIYMGVKTS